MDMTRRVALILCIIPALYFGASVFFALLNFRDYASELPQFVRYVLAPGLLALAFFACAFVVPARIAISVGSSGLAVLGAFFAFELLMTIKVFTSLMDAFGAGQTASLTGRGAEDGLPPGYTVKRLNRALKSTSLPEAMLGGIPKSEVLLCRQDQTPVFYRADRFGFNNPDQVYEIQTDIVVLGDSFIEGMCQKPGEDVVGELRKTHPGSISIALRGAGPLGELARLGRYGPVLRPRHVVMAFFEGNDWENLEQELTTPWLRPALSPDATFGSPAMPQGILAKAKEIVADVQAENVAAVEVLQKTSIVRNFFALNQTATQLGLSYPKTSPAQPEYAEVLHRVKQLTSSWGGELILLYIPQAIRYQGLLERDFVHDQLRMRVLAAAAEAQVGVIDLALLFRQHPNPSAFYASDAHFSEEGAAFAAQAIVERINPRPNAQLGLFRSDGVRKDALSR